jgi:hypothetical protein
MKLGLPIRQGHSEDIFAQLNLERLVFSWSIDSIWSLLEEVTVVLTYITLCFFNQLQRHLGHPLEKNKRNLTK